MGLLTSLGLKHNSENILNRENSVSSHSGVTSEDLRSRAVDVVIFAVTTNCNLRCTYCAVSHPGYKGENFDLSRNERLAEEFALANVKLVQISGHGETTILPEWNELCSAYERHGIGVCITSNFSKIFSETELATLARMVHITISIDTVDRKLLQVLRRKVDLRTILYNMSLVRLHAQRIGCIPRFNWQCTLSDAVDGLSDWLELGILNGVTEFTLGNLLEYSGLIDSPRHVAKLDGDKLITACKQISSLCERASRAGVNLTIQPGIVEGINEKLRSSGINRPFVPGAT